MSNKSFNTIILPPLPSEKIPDPLNKFKYKLYLEGKIKFEPGCFAGLKNATIIVPFENSIEFTDAFDKDSQIELILPKDYSLKEVFSKEDTLIDYYHKNWTIIADKELSVPLNIGRDEYRIGEAIANTGIKISQTKNNLDINL